MVGSGPLLFWLLSQWFLLIQHVSSYPYQYSRLKPRRRSPPNFRATSHPEDAVVREMITQQLGYWPSNCVRIAARTNQGVPIAIRCYPLDGGAPRRQAKALFGRSSRRPSSALGVPFPTLYWLTHPGISRAIADMERKGYVEQLEQEIRWDAEKGASATTPSLAERWCQCQEDYARERWNSLSEEDRQLLLGNQGDDDHHEEDSSLARMRHMLQDSGVAGTNKTPPTTASSPLWIPSVKCLHAQFAHYASVLSSSSSGPGSWQTLPSAHLGCLNPVGRRVHELLLAEYPQALQQ